MRLSDSGCSKLILLAVLGHQMPSQVNDGQYQQRVAAHMRRERNEIPRRVPGQKHLRTGCVSGTPGAEVRCHDDRLLRLAGDVAADHRHGQSLGGPEGEHDVI